VVIKDLNTGERVFAPWKTFPFYVLRTLLRAVRTTRTELVASDKFLPELSVGTNLGMCSRHRVLFMQLDYSGVVDTDEWKRVAVLTADNLDRLRQGLRADLMVHKPARELKGKLRNRLRSGVRKNRRLQGYRRNSGIDAGTWATQAMNGDLDPCQVMETCGVRRSSESVVR
jgi:hypothetical protein